MNNYQVLEVLDILFLFGKLFIIQLCIMLLGEDHIFVNVSTQIIIETLDIIIFHMSTRITYLGRYLFKQK